ncbi:MAG: hypothetical protein V7607_6728 [Solirubrobacteraceae bacterium]
MSRRLERVVVGQRYTKLNGSVARALVTGGVSLSSAQASRPKPSCSQK